MTARDPGLEDLLEQIGGMTELDDYQQGFIDAELFRMGVVDREPTEEEFAAAICILERFVRAHSPREIGATS